MSSPFSFVRIFKRVFAGLVLGLGALILLAPAAESASSWNPTLLVNTESFQTIDVGDGTTNIELKFGSTLDARIIYDRTNSRFNFTKPVFVQGAITATGTLTVRSTMSGYSLRVSGQTDIHGPLNASGSVRTDGDLTINDDQTAADAVLTFGQPTTNQTLKYLNSGGRFQFSKPVSVLGTITGSSLNVDRNATVGGTLTVSGALRAKSSISGSSLTIDGGLTIHGLNYTLPASRGAAGTFLREDGAGALTWVTPSVGNGSGEIMSLHPLYPNATYTASGSSNNVGQLSAAYDSTNKQNYYHWTSTKGTMQDYWIAARVRIPDNFSSWDPVKPIELRYRTGSGLSITNHVTVRVLDTAGAEVSLTNGGALANINWTTASITGPQSAGTWTPKAYMTIFVKLATITPADTNDTGFADVGFLNLNWETTTP